MAEQYDGSIRINTKMDSSGFDKGSDELLKAIQSLTKEIENLGQTIQTTFGQVGRSMQSATSGAKDFSSAAKDASKSAKDMGSAADDLDKKMGSAKSSAQQAADAAKNMGSAKSPVGDINMGNSVVSTTELERGLETCDKRLESLAVSAKYMDKSSSASMNRFRMHAENVDNDIARMRSKVEEFGRTRFKSAAYEDLSKQIGVVEERLTALKDK